MDYETHSKDLLGSMGRSRQAAPYGLVKISGPDAAEFLHRMCSQDIAGMASGEVRSGAFLNGKGKLLAVCELLLDRETIWLSTQEQLVESLAEMLERFHFTEALTVEAPADLACADLLTLQSLGDLPAGRGDLAGEGLVRMAGVRNGVHWLRCHGPREQVDAWLADRAPRAEDAHLECLRFVLREPRVGADSEPNTLALEWPIDDHISTTKGCYTGQEVVARIHTYGHTNRSLCLLGIEGSQSIEASAPIVEVEDGDPVGRVMSSAVLPDGTGQLAFGFLPSDFIEVGTELALKSLDGPKIVVL